MSYDIGMKIIGREPTSRFGHTAYAFEHFALHRAVENATALPFNEAWDLDLLWCTHDGPVPWSARGRVTDMGHSEFATGGIDRRDPGTHPFTDPEQVLEFDAVREYGLPDFEKLVDFYEKWHFTAQHANPNQVVTGGYYKTIMSGAIEAFGWEMLLMAAADQERFAKVLDSFFRLSLHHYKAWAATSAHVFISHDDMVWTSGPFLDPTFYREIIFPRYAELWDVLKQAGKTVLFCSDGDFSVFIDDIAAAGADGFIFEPITPLAAIVEKYGRSHVIVGSKVDCRTLTFGTHEQILREIEETVELTRDCPGFMFAVGNHIPSNVPIENALFYMDELRKRWARPV